MRDNTLVADWLDEYDSLVGPRAGTRVGRNAMSTVESNRGSGPDDF